MATKNHDYADGETSLKGYLSYRDDINKPAPAVIVFHDWTGRNAFADKKADEMAELGYIGFAADVYGEGKQGSTIEEKSALISPFMEDRNKLLARIMAAFRTVSELPEVCQDNIAAIGFCFGGLCALDLARSGEDFRGAVSFHGLLHPAAKPAQKIRAKILALHGYDDPMATPQQMQAFAQEMTQANADWQIHAYGNTQHAFTNPLANDAKLGTIYNAVAAKRATNSMQAFLAEIFIKNLKEQQNASQKNRKINQANAKN